MTTIRPSDPGLDGVWRLINRRLDQLEGFGFLVVFVRDLKLVAPLMAMAQSWCDSAGRRLGRVAEPDPAGFAARSLSGLFARLQEEPEQLLWLEAQRGSGQPDWDRERVEFLSRLNERRSRLEKESLGPLILLLPEDAQRDMASLAPDLWHARYLSVVLQAERRSSILAPSEPDAGPAMAYRASSDQRAGDVDDFDEDGDPADLLVLWNRVIGDRSASVADVANDEVRRIVLSRWIRCVAVALIQGRRGLAEALARKALSLAQARVDAGERSQSAAALLELAICAKSLADTLLVAADFRGGYETLQRGIDALRLFKETAAANPGGYLTLFLAGQANAALQLGDLEAALAAATERVEIGRELVREAPASVDQRMELADSLRGLATVLRRSDALQPAAARSTESVDLYRELLTAAGGGESAVLDGLAAALMTRGMILADAGEVRKALKDLSESVALRRQAVAANSHHLHRLGLAASLDMFAMVARSAGDSAAASEAMDEVRTGLRSRVEALGRSRDALEDLGMYLSQRADVLGDEGWRTEAVDVFTELANRFPEFPQYRQHLTLLLEQGESSHS